MRPLRFRDIAGVALLLSWCVSEGTPVHGSDDSGLVVHEWGTFTSVAGEDGRAVDWLPLRRADDLPCFVEHLGLDFKGTLSAKVRMETPVLYFYTLHDVKVDVTVRFNRGLVTDWFPHAAVTPSTVDASGAAGYRRAGFSSSVTWQGVSVSPQATAWLPDDRRGGHYYAARRTDAAPLTLGGVSEKFLFYRGVGGFEPPVSAAVMSDGRVEVSGISRVGDIMLFENRGGRISSRSLTVPGTRATLNPPTMDGESATPQAELEKMLIGQGLFPAEAKAMIETWRDSWFEEGARLFYIAPRAAIDNILAIQISPAPSSLARVFVGRVELITPATRRAVGDALVSNDRLALSKYARFLPVILGSLPDPRTSDERTSRALALQTAAQSGSARPPLCAGRPD
jgi:hypothetical protein